MVIIQKPLKVNFDVGRGGRKPLFIVIHVVGLPGITAEAALGKASQKGLGHFSNPNSEVSSHYVVKKDGTIWRFLKETDTAWANGQIGKNFPTANIAAMYYKLGISLNQVSISIENEGSEYADIPEAQYKANAELVRDICKRWQIPLDRLHVIGHREIKDTKVCPGKISVDKIVSLALASSPIQPDIPTPVFTPPYVPNPTQTKINLMQQILALYQQLLAALLLTKTFGVARSGDWFSWRREHIHPNCDICGTTKKLELHHILPFHLFPSQEKNPDNVVTLCRRCHKIFGHLDNFYSYNPDVKKDIVIWEEKIVNRI